jgi:hypothetical protein
MSNEDQRAPSMATRSSRPYVLAVALVATAIVAGLLVATRRGDAENTSSPSPSRSEIVISPSTRALDSKGEVVARLREILEVREQAFRERNSGLFDSVYTSDCACLRAGRDGIAALKRERVLWKNRSISIEVESAKSMNDRLWEVVGLFISNPFRIETEEGVLVRNVPATRLRYRFLLVRASEADPWRLGSASPVEG